MLHDLSSASKPSLFLFTACGKLISMNGEIAFFDELDPEARLVARCAQARPSLGAKNDIGQLFDRELHWPAVLQHVQQHQVAPLAHQNLKAHWAHVPPAVRTELEQQARIIAFRNLQHMQALLEVVQKLEEQELPVIPFKGPTLAAVAYGNVAHRPFVDLDILARRKDVPAIRNALIDADYHPAKEMDPDEEKAYIDTGLGYEFVHQRKGTVVEVHWTFFYEIYAFKLAPDAVWGRHEWVSLSGTNVRSLAPEDLFLYLCAHGTKHRWSRLKWIADVAALVRSQSSINWQTVVHRACDLGVQRMLHLGMLLADAVLDADIPSPMQRAVRDDQTARALAQQVCAEWLFRDPDAPPTPEWEVFRFHLRERERWRDRWPYIKHHLELWALPK